MKVFILLLLNFGLVFGGYCNNDATKEYDGLGTYNIEGCANTEIFMMDPRSSNASIKILKARKNVIETLDENDMRVMEEVEEVDLSENKIEKSVDRSMFIHTRKIRKLNLSKNKIDELGFSIFEYLEQLESADLSHNQLMTIENAVFKSVPKLQVINLSNNQISTIQLSAIIDLPALRNLNLMDNACINENFKFANEDEASAFDEKLITSGCTIKEISEIQNRHGETEEPEPTKKSTTLEIIAFVICLASIVLNVVLGRHIHQKKSSKDTASPTKCAASQKVNQCGPSNTGKGKGDGSEPLYDELGNTRSEKVG
jgi:hypothetical protein